MLATLIVFFNEVCQDLGVELFINAKRKLTIKHKQNKLPFQQIDFHESISLQSSCLHIFQAPLEVTPTSQKH